MISPGFDELFLTSVGVVGIGVACDLKWREYPSWAFWLSVAVIAFMWYWTFRSMGWMAGLRNPTLISAIRLVAWAVGLSIVYWIGKTVGMMLYSAVGSGGGDASFIGILSLLLPITPIWLSSPSIFPHTGQGIRYVEYLPIDFWANVVLFVIIFIVGWKLFARLVWKLGVWRPEDNYVIPLMPLIAGCFYLTILLGGIWRGVVDPIIPIALGATLGG